MYAKYVFDSRFLISIGYKKTELKIKLKFNFIISSLKFRQLKFQIPYVKNSCTENSFWCEKKWKTNMIEVKLEGNDGNFSSFPVPYNSNSHIQYVVTAEDGSEFTGEFSMMDIEGYPTNCYDYLMVVVDGIYSTI